VEVGFCVATSGTVVTPTLKTFEALETLCIVDLAFVFVGEDFVGSVHLFEGFCCLLVTWVLVWMILEGELPELSLDISLVCVSFNL